MASKAAAKRLGKEAVNMEADPPPYCYARPREDNVLEWHFILRGPPDTPYDGGEYWGQLLFPSDYPFKPPGIKVQTPSGRFSPNTKICTSMSDFHPGSWNPSWSVANILVGLLSFMTGEEMTTGSVSASAKDRRSYAAQSHAWNIKQRKFVALFPEYAKPTVTPLPNMGQRSLPQQKQPAPKPASTSTTPTTSTATEAVTDPAAAAPTTVPPNPELTAPPAADVADAAAAPGESTAGAGEERALTGIAARRANRKAALNRGGKVNEHPGAPPARGIVGTLLNIGQRKLAFAAAVVAYLFLSRLASRMGSVADAPPA